MEVVDHDDGTSAPRGGGDPPGPASPAGIDTETGEVVDISDAEPTTAAGHSPEAMIDQTPPRRDPGGAPATPAEAAEAPVQLTPEERHALQLLVAQAARAEGLAGRTPGQDWLARHYGARTLDHLVDNLDDVRERAMAVLAAREKRDGRASSASAPEPDPLSGDTTAAAPTAERRPDDTTPAPAPAGGVNGELGPRVARMPASEFRALVHKAAVVQRIKSPTPGKAWLRERYGTDNPVRLTDAQYEDAVRQARAIVDAAAPGTRLASADAIARLGAAFDRLQYDEPGRAGLIRACTNDRTGRAEEMTEAEILALIDELGGPASGTPVDASAATPPPAA